MSLNILDKLNDINDRINSDNNKIDKIEKVNDTQTKDINNCLLANAEIFEMIMNMQMSNAQLGAALEEIKNKG